MTLKSKNFFRGKLSKVKQAKKIRFYTAFKIVKKGQVKICFTLYLYLSLKTLKSQAWLDQASECEIPYLPKSKGSPSEKLRV